MVLVELSDGRIETEGDTEREMDEYVLIEVNQTKNEIEIEIEMRIRIRMNIGEEIYTTIV
jgi:hypothetical protein